MIGQRYWSTGIKLKPHGGGEWSLSLEFVDDGFCQTDATQGTLAVRYLVPTGDLETSAATLKFDAERLGIVWYSPADGWGGGATVYMEHDGELDGGDRPDLRRLANEVAVSLGWAPCYSRDVLSAERGR